MGCTMETNDQVYFRLQKHLDRQAVGFPATKSGAEIRILKHIFTPREADIATCLSYKPEPVETIFNRARHLVESKEELSAALDGILKKGGVESKTKDDKRHYYVTPLVVGMYEMQLGRLTPEFLRDFTEYTSDRRFGVEFLGTELPQMRTIPVGKSIDVQHNVSTFDEVSALVMQSGPPFAILECICRKKKSIEGTPCKVTSREETCLGIGQMGESILESGFGRKISLDEAMNILEKNQKEGLVLQPSNSEKAEFVCSCCGCCCGMLQLHQKLPKPLDFWASNFQARVETDTCSGCGACEQRCQVGAVRVSKTTEIAAVDLNRCIGCGLCVPVCPEEAISLIKKPIETKPPKTREELYDIIMANKKGRFGKAKLTGKLIADTIRTKRTDLMK